MNLKLQLHRIHYIFIGIFFILLIPFVAMQFTDEVQWKTNDFVIMALLLSIAGLLSEWVLRKNKKKIRRVFLIGAVILSFLLIWIELAVGIFN